MRHLERLHQQLTRHAEQARSLVRTARQALKAGEIPASDALLFSDTINVLKAHAVSAAYRAGYISQTWPSPSPTTEPTTMPTKQALTPATIDPTLQATSDAITATQTEPRKPYSAEQLESAMERARGADVVTFDQAAQRLQAGGEPSSAELRIIDALMDRYPEEAPGPDHLTRPDIDEALGYLSDIASILAFIMASTLGHELTDDGEIKPIAGKGKV